MDELKGVWGEPGFLSSWLFGTLKATLTWLSSDNMCELGSAWGGVLGFSLEELVALFTDKKVTVKSAVTKKGTGFYCSRLIAQPAAGGANQKKGRFF